MNQHFKQKLRWIIRRPWDPHFSNTDTDYFPRFRLTKPKLGLFIGHAACLPGGAVEFSSLGFWQWVEDRGAGADP